MPHNSTGTVVFYAKDLGEIRPESPQVGAPNADGQVKIGEFQQITCYISKMVEDRCVVSIKVEWKAMCALSSGDIAYDLELPLTTLPPFPHFLNLALFFYFFLNGCR